MAVAKRPRGWINGALRTFPLIQHCRSLQLMRLLRICCEFQCSEQVKLANNHKK
jgi:hypothetical protein